MGLAVTTGVSTTEICDTLACGGRIGLAHAQDTERRFVRTPVP